MKKLLPLIALATMSFTAIAQTQQQKIDSVCQLMKQYFNAKDADKIYSLAGEAFKKQLSIETFKQVCNTNLFPLGELKETVFEKIADGVSKYKAVFTNATLDLLLSLDSADKIQVFLFRPYTDASAKKTGKILFTNPLATLLDKQVDSLLQPFMAQINTVGVSIAVLKNGKIYNYGYGETAKGNNQIPAPNTIFEIGSISKTFTATLLADAVNKGKISLDDPANKYLPDSIPKLVFEGTPITIKTLINHSSGIPRVPFNIMEGNNNMADPYAAYDDKKLFEFYKKFKPTRKPGEKYEYSNLAAGTLGVILERINKSTYEQMLLKTICEPLGMHDTRQYLRKEDSTRFAKGYAEGNYTAPWHFKALVGAGGIRSTAADMAKYAEAQLGKAPANLNKDVQLTHAVTFKSTEATVALAWHIIKPGKDDLLFHNGGTGGYRSYLALNLQKNYAVVMLSNTTIGVDELGNDLMKWLETDH